jgi:hypothetical protein
MMRPEPTAPVPGYRPGRWRFPPLGGPQPADSPDDAAPFLFERAWWCRPLAYFLSVAGWSLVIAAAVVPALGRIMPRFPFANPWETLGAIAALWVIGALAALLGGLWITEALFRAWWRLWGWRRAVRRDSLRAFTEGQ